MKKILFTILILMYASTCFGVILTKEQFKNQDVIDRELRKEYPSYAGMSGSQDKMIVYGINDLTAQNSIDSMNIDKLKKKDPRRLETKKLRKKFKALGLDDADLKRLGLINDIPDEDI